MKSFIPLDALQIDLGTEWLLLAQTTEPIEHIVSIGKIDGQLMPQYVPMHTGSSQRGTRWQLVPADLGTSVLLCLLPKAQCTPLTVGIGLALKNRARLIMRFVPVTVSESVQARQWLSHPAVAAAAGALVPLDKQALSVVLSSVAPERSVDLPGSQIAFEGVIDGYAHGWALDTRNPGSTVWVLVRDAAGHLVGSGEANLPRADLVMLGVTDRAVGFRIPLSACVRDGETHHLSLHQTTGLPFVGAEVIQHREPPIEPQSFLLCDSGGFMSQWDTAWPDCDRDLRLTAEKLRLAVEINDVTGATACLSILGLTDPRIHWLLELSKAELSMATRQIERAIACLNKAATCLGADLALLQACKNLLRLQHSGT